MNKELVKLIQPELTEKEIRDLCRAKKDELGFDIEKAMFPLNPLTDVEEPLISIEDAVVLVEQWDRVRASVGGSVGGRVRDSVWDSVGGSVWDSVGASVWDSVGASVWDSVGASVWDSVRASVWAYQSSIFHGISDWKHIDHKVWENPFKPAIDLWEAGYLCSFDEEKYRLHVGTDAKIVWEGVVK
jgi:hypothetical protein